MQHGPIPQASALQRQYGSAVERRQQGDNHKPLVAPGSARPAPERGGQQTGFTCQPQMMG